MNDSEGFDNSLYKHFTVYCIYEAVALKQSATLSLFAFYTFTAYICLCTVDERMNRVVLMLPLQEITHTEVCFYDKL